MTLGHKDALAPSGVFLELPVLERRTSRQMVLVSLTGLALGSCLFYPVFLFLRSLGLIFRYRGYFHFNPSSAPSLSTIFFEF